MVKIHAFVYLLAALVLVTASVIPMRRQRRTTRSSTTVSTTEGNYFFEGVDYELMPEDLRKEHGNCDGEHLRCIRKATYIYPVCAYNVWNYHYEDFPSICEVDLYTCNERIRTGKGVHGTDYMKDWVFYNGEELNCLYYYRRVRNSEEMDILYFGDKNPPYRSLSTPEKYLLGSINGTSP